MSKKRRMWIDLTAPIEPGRSAAGIKLGEHDALLPRPLKAMPLSEGELFEYASLQVQLKQGTVFQVGVRQGYSGTLPEGIEIGSSIADVERLIGCVEEDLYDNLIVVGYPGWCFETEVWVGHDITANRNAKITEIFFFRPSK